MSPIDREAHLNRWRGKPLAEKLLLALGMMVLALVLKPWPGAAVVAVAMTGAALLGARVSLKVWGACAAAPVGFLAVGAVSLALRIDGHGVGLAPGGFEAAGDLAVKSFAGVTCLLFLALTTPTSDLLAGARRIGVPSEITELALLMYRFLFILADAAVAMDAAQAARLGHATKRRRLRSLGLLAANLLPRALDRARRMEVGLFARGWRGEMRVLSDRPGPSARGMALVCAVLGATALVGVLP
ncbi:cobalt ECF transporter T component CbiQ [Rhodoblastus sphagnicola]|uniref:Cobalt ECF transporter T component CbiQ n=1 Tax=Rhodoblastus sphagnicola TaxID=333368 RepID=A0A2S6N8Y6_9HYPH|nr:cobalt ECF transporter T component CbiQ [Rhodoblastus sphagnicola]MBB4196861.1 cobalt/nickel transport system permease protein [Rhodoblastus sphagnicola]PPQ31083.1 cobalt ECF transporter T component CbiQ [Rhodoblastus sphagnicola]